MAQIEISSNGFVIDAALIAEAFGLAPENVQPLMRSGQITSLSETGVDEDAGRARLTFHYKDRAVRLIVDQFGHILKRVNFPIRGRST